MFLNISKWLATITQPPKVVVLENMPGLLQKNKHGIASIEFILYGKINESVYGKYGPVCRTVEYGLTYLSRYRVIQAPRVISSKNLGLPMLRKRVFIVLGRTDVKTEDWALQLPNVLDALARHVPHKTLAIEACLMDDRTGGIQWSS